MLVNNSREHVISCGHAGKRRFAVVVGSYAPSAVTKGRGMGKIWLGVVVLALEAVVLVWLVGGHVLQWGGSGPASG
jgi:hypothetical protein